MKSLKSNKSTFLSSNKYHLLSTGEIHKALYLFLFKSKNTIPFNSYFVGVVLFSINFSKFILGSIIKLIFLFSFKSIRKIKNFEYENISFFDINKNKYNALCVSPVDKKWYLYDDENVELSNFQNYINLYLNNKNFIPHILLYNNIDENKSNKI